METEEWFKPKKYPHIGSPITLFDYKWIKDYVTTTEKVRVHSFLPLIHKTIKQRKYRADNTTNEKTPTKKRFRNKDEKKRDIYFASHLDAQIFSYYNAKLVEAYEDYISEESFNDSVVAYRKIPVSNSSKNNKCNIEFAKSTFEFIKENQDKKLSVIVADVTCFFDNLNRKILKKQWCKILKVKSLPADEKSNTVMYDINNGDHIKKQSKKLWRNFHKLMNEHK